MTGPRAACSLVLLAALAGCGGSKTSPPPPDRASATPSDEDMDRLRSLPYAGFARGSAGEPSGVTVYDPARSQPGVDLYTIQQLSTAELIDERGRVLRSWHRDPPFTWERANLLANGDLVVIGADPPLRPGPGIPDDKRYIARYDWNGTLLWKRSLRAHHDVERTPSGRLLTLTFERKRVPAFGSSIDTRDDLLTLLDDDGRVVDRLSLLDAFSRTPGLDVVPVGPSTLGVVPWLDLFHVNAAEWMHRPELAKSNPIYGPDNVLICSRHQNRIAIVSWAHRRVVWSWGPGELLGPHDAQVLPSGHVLVFDNGMGRGWSRVVEVDPATDRIVWEYRAKNPRDFYSLSKGSCQRLANGDTLIADSDNGTAFEVTPAGEIVWRFATPHRGPRGERLAIVRMRRIDRSVVDALSSAHGDSGSSR